MIPYARSYSANDWESAPGPKAAPSSAIGCSSGVCTVELPTPSSGTYVIMTKETRFISNSRKIARFLLKTSFGPKMDEIAAFDAAGNFGENERATALRAQINLPKSSHREYFRLNANAKWDATTINAKSGHPCDPNSRWRNYAYTKHDRQHTIDESYITTTFEEVAAEADYTYAIYEADSEEDITISSCNIDSFKNATNGNSGFSGDGYYDFGCMDDFIEFNISLPEDTETLLSFRYAMGSSSYNYNRPCVLLVNNVTVRDIYDFSYTDSWSYWKYSELVNVSLKAGHNTVKLLVRDQNGGPNIDHMRLGKPPAVQLRTGGWVRAIAKNGVNVIDGWGPEFDFTNQTVYFTLDPDPKQGDYPRYPFGRLRVNTTAGNKYVSRTSY